METDLLSAKGEELKQVQRAARAERRKLYLRVSPSPPIHLTICVLTLEESKHKKSAVGKGNAKIAQTHFFKCPIISNLGFGSRAYWQEEEKHSPSSEQAVPQEHDGKQATAHAKAKRLGAEPEPA